MKKVVCVDNKRTNGEIFPLTIGKVYEFNGDTYHITCNNGEVFHLSSLRFVSLEEWREKKLEKLGI